MLTICACAKASIIISSLEIGDTLLRFNISGTMPNTAPTEIQNVIFLANPNEFAFPGVFTGIDNDSELTSVTFTGTQTIPAASAIPRPVSEDPFGVDVLYIEFEENFVAGEAISGTLTAMFDKTTFNPSEASSLDFYWGRTQSSGNPVDNSIFLSSASISAIPEPSSAILMGISGLLFALGRRRKKH